MERFGCGRNRLARRQANRPQHQLPRAGLAREAGTRARKGRRQRDRAAAGAWPTWQGWSGVAVGEECGKAATPSPTELCRQRPRAERGAWHKNPFAGLAYSAQAGGLSSGQYKLHFQGGKALPAKPPGSARQGGLRGGGQRGRGQQEGRALVYAGCSIQQMLLSEMSFPRNRVICVWRASSNGSHSSPCTLTSHLGSERNQPEPKGTDPQGIELGSAAVPASRWIWVNIGKGL